MALQQASNAQQDQSIELQKLMLSTMAESLREMKSDVREIKDRLIRSPR
jgi:hypothetical protein